jgi:hypothetical protein
MSVILPDRLLWHVVEFGTSKPSSSLGKFLRKKTTKRKKMGSVGSKSGSTSGSKSGSSQNSSGSPSGTPGVILVGPLADGNGDGVKAKYAAAARPDGGAFVV